MTGCPRCSAIRVRFDELAMLAVLWLLTAVMDRVATSVSPMGRPAIFGHVQLVLSFATALALGRASRSIYERQRRGGDAP